MSDKENACNTEIYGRLKRKKDSSLTQLITLISCSIHIKSLFLHRKETAI